MRGNWQYNRYSLFLVSMLFLLQLSVYSWSFIIIHCPIHHPILLLLREGVLLIPSFGILKGSIMARLYFFTKPRDVLPPIQ